MERQTIHLQHCITRQIVDAVFIEDVAKPLIVRAEMTWRPEFRKRKEEALARGVSEDKLPLEHTEWDWEKKKKYAAKSSRFFGVEYDGRMQGLMMTSLDLVSSLPGQEGLPLVYVDYLEVAPWNQKQLVVERPFEGLGGLFLEIAINQSRELGYEGRIGLHSLKQSESFYRRCRMTDRGEQKVEYNLSRRYFEMTPQQATSFLEEGY